MIFSEGGKPIVVRALIPIPALKALQVARRLELEKAIRQEIPSLLSAKDAICLILQLGPRTANGSGGLSKEETLHNGE
jgi:hypothetical protein